MLALLLGRNYASLLKLCKNYASIIYKGLARAGKTKAMRTRLIFKRGEGSRGGGGGGGRGRVHDLIMTVSRSSKASKGQVAKFGTRVQTWRQKFRK